MEQLLRHYHFNNTKYAFMDQGETVLRKWKYIKPNNPLLFTIPSVKAMSKPILNEPSTTTINNYPNQPHKLLLAPRHL